jgi:ATP-grasp domain, R2K clade family 3
VTPVNPGADNTAMLLLVPSDVLRPRRVDDHYAAEADAALAAGHQVGLVDHDALAQGAADRAVTRVPAGPAVAAYRGWMLSSDRYAAFAQALADRGIRLRTDATAYRRSHELPGWYHELEAFTPASRWTVGAEQAAFDEARQRLGGGPAVLRDHTKSMKHYWHEAAFIPDLADAAAAWKVAERLRELRGEDLAGGFVLRRFEPFGGAEVRTWWVNGVCRLVTAHPDTPDQAPPPDAEVTPELAAAVQGLSLPFVTVDLARRTDDGTWRVVELGDGQVSDRPTTTSAESLISVAVADDLALQDR